MFFDPPPKRSLTQRQKILLWERAKKSCEACGDRINSPLNGHAGHKKAYSIGGRTTSQNMVFLCMPCNTRQGTRSWGEFISQSYKQEPKKFKKAYLKVLLDFTKDRIEKNNKLLHKLRFKINNSRSEKNKIRYSKIIEKLQEAIILLESDLKKMKKGIVVKIREKIKLG